MDEQGKANDLDTGLLATHDFVYKEISCSPHLMLLERIPIRKGSHKICPRRLL